MNVKTILRELEKLAPPVYQESYDNAGLIVGDFAMEVTGVLLCLDSIEAVVEEALAKGCNLIVAHHPIVFSGLKRLNGNNYVERTIIKAIKNDIAIYAIHTNLDNVMAGVNRKIADKLGLQNLQILAPKSGLLQKLYTFCPESHADAVRDALFEAGAGNIGNYDECSFNLKGTGTFRGGTETQPFIGQPGTRSEEPEIKLEVILPAARQRQVIAALNKSHPYEEVAYDVVALENEWQEVGSGMVGYLPEALSEVDFLQHLKTAMQTQCIRHTALLDQPIEKVAVCGGAGRFLLSHAKRSGAQIFITSDFKYHEFFDADNDLIIADIGHYESEQFTAEILHTLLTEKFPNFAVRLSDINTNPINYF
ncbi:MAG: Nif3-like dinuclear metal center hexameric protein [Salibacteraceae bacterium]